VTLDRQGVPPEVRGHPACRYVVEAVEDEALSAITATAIAEFQRTRREAGIPWQSRRNLHGVFSLW